MTTKHKPFRCQVTNIVIGTWTCVAMYPESILAKCYFPEKKLIWEFLEDEGTGPDMMRMKRKMEIEWSDILSCRTRFHSVDATGILELELSKRPTFYMEIDPQPRKPTRWGKTDEDFTQNQASNCRTHTLRFASGVLQEMMQRLVSGDSFWSEIVKVPFPTLSNSLYFQGQTLTSNVNDFLHGQSQGFGRVGLGEGNTYMETQFRPNDGNELEGRTFLGTDFYNRIYQDMQEIRCTGNLLGAGRSSTVYANRNDNNIISSSLNVNSSLLHQQPQGGINSNIPTHFWYDDGTHMTSIVEDNIREEQQ